MLKHEICIFRPIVVAKSTGLRWTLVMRATTIIPIPCGQFGAGGDKTRFGAADVPCMPKHGMIEGRGPVVDGLATKKIKQCVRMRPFMRFCAAPETDQRVKHVR